MIQILVMLVVLMFALNLIGAVATAIGETAGAPGCAIAAGVLLVVVLMLLAH